MSLFLFYYFLSITSAFDKRRLEFLRFDVLNAINEEKVGLIRGSPHVHPLDFLMPQEYPLLASLVRLAFHDCVGFSIDENKVENRKRYITHSFCNGCINVNDASNSGLDEGAIQPMELICSDYPEISTADCWAISATFAVEYASQLTYTALIRLNQKIPGIVRASELNEYKNSYIASGQIPYYYGRQDCKTPPYSSRVFEFPSSMGGWADTKRYFKARFAFTNREIVTIMGSHSLGRGHLLKSGFAGPWDLTPQGLDNFYFKALMNMEPISKRLGFVNNWRQVKWKHSNQTQWTTSNAKNNADLPLKNMFFMLNADIGMSFNIQGYVNEGNAENIDCFTDKQNEHQSQCKYLCTYKEYTDYVVGNRFDELDDNSECVMAFVEHYIQNNTRFLIDYAKVFTKMITVGYVDQTGKVNLKRIDY